MIPAINIKTVISKLSTEIGITIIRSDQAGEHPPYPFGTYKMITSNEESAFQDIRQVIENGDDSTSVDIKTFEKSEGIMSFNFLDKSRTDRLYTIATNALRWFKSIEGREFIKNNDLTVQILDPIIEDRTIYQDAYFENRIGFDLRFDHSGLITETIEAIESMDIGVTRDGVPQADIEITIP
jgi:hypothetical protein